MEILKSIARTATLGAALLLGAGLAAAPARADSIMVPITYPPGANFTANGVYSDPFGQFNPSLGTLDSYSLTVAGTVTATGDVSAPEIVFKAPGTFDALLELTADNSGTISGSGGTSSAGDIAAVTGTGTVQFLAQDFSFRGGVTTIDFTTDYVTYNYTPTIAVPEPGSLALLGTGLFAVGLLGFVSRRRLAG